MEREFVYLSVLYNLKPEMKKLLLTFILLLPLANLYAQDLSIEMRGTTTWEQTNFQISITQKGTSVTIKYKLKVDADREALRKDSAAKALPAKYKNARTDPKEEQKLVLEFAKISERYRKSYQDSLTVDIEQQPKYKKLLTYITNANHAMFHGGVNLTSDQDELYCTITFKDKVISFEKIAPLAVTSPLLYALIRETLRLGEEAGTKSALKIGEVFKYLL